MKNLKLGFAAVIAILAIGATLASFAGAFKAKEVKAAGDCYTNFTSIVNPSNCVAITPIPTDCSIAKSVLPGKAFLRGAQISTECTEVGDVFCCATVKAATNSCPNTVANQVIDQVLCRLQ